MGANGFSGPDGATTEVVANGLVGSALTNFLNLLGAGPVTTLTNSVTAPGHVIDGKLSTFATFSLPVGLLGPLDLIDSVCTDALFPSALPRSTERRVSTAGDSRCRFRWYAYNE